VREEKESHGVSGYCAKLMTNVDDDVTSQVARPQEVCGAVGCLVSFRAKGTTRHPPSFRRTIPPRAAAGGLQDDDVEFVKVAKDRGVRVSGDQTCWSVQPVGINEPCKARFATHTHDRGTPRSKSK
jgi:hypothetical protein